MPEGWISARSVSIGGTSYALGYGYDNHAHLASVTYPDGNQAHYTYTHGVVSGVTLTVGGASVNGATAITYRPGDLWLCVDRVYGESIPSCPAPSH